MKPFIINRDVGSTLVGTYIITVSSWVDSGSGFGADGAQSYLADVDNAFKIMKEILVDSDMEVSPGFYEQSHSRNNLKVTLGFAIDGLTFEDDLYLGAGTDHVYLDYYLDAMNELGDTANRPLDQQDMISMRVTWTANVDKYTMIVNLSKVQAVVA